jgi:hypothetical protein
VADVPQPGSPEAWLTTLSAGLDARRSAIEVYDRYYEGDQKMAFATAKFREAFGSLFDAFADNWCEVVVDAPVERLKVQGFRFGENADGDEAAWEIWQRNNLDQAARIAHTEAVKLGTAYWLVGPDEDGKALITGEHPFQVICAHAPGNRRVRLAALKKWMGEDGFAYANVYLPDAVHKFRSEKEIKGQASPSKVTWVDAGAVDNPLGVVPVVPLENNPSMLRGGRSDLQKAVPLQDAINKLVMDMIVASEYAGYRQRFATGIEIPEDPETGQPLDREKWLSAVSRMWAVPDENAKFGEFDVTPLDNYVNGVGMLLQHFSAQTRTPPHYLLGQIVNVSGDALKAAETGLTSRCWAKIEDFGDGHEEAVRLGFKLEGQDAKAAQTDGETIWANPEVRSDAERMDAAVKMRALGLPFEMCWEFMGLSPQQIERAKQLTGLPDRPPPGATTPDAANGTATTAQS